ncbi:MAG TPA: hypothetical protein VF720_10580 [Candidatus Eisenbacteria bacterium]
MKSVLFWITAAITMVVSVAVSLVYFNLAMNLIPAAFLSQFNRAAAQTAFIFWGIGLGLAVAVLEGLLFWILPRVLPRRSAA